MKSIIFFILGIFILNEPVLSQNLLTYTNQKGKIKRVKSMRDWQKKRHQILDSMQAIMGDIPNRENLPDLIIQIKDSLVTENYTRYSIVFQPNKDEDVTCYLYTPTEIKKNEKRAAMLVLHGTGALGKRIVDGESPRNNRAQAKELAQRGYVVIAPDYPSMGEQADYNFENDRYESGTMKAIFNHMRCIDLLETLDYVDADRIGVLGHSLGGHNAMFVGAFDERLKVIVSSCGWTPMSYYNTQENGVKVTTERLKPWAQTRYMPLLGTKYSLDGEDFPFDFDGVIAALAPRAFFSNSPIHDSNFDVEGVKVGIKSASEVYRFMKAEGNLQVRYPNADHDFPTEVRSEAYLYIDKVLGHTAKIHPLE